MSDSDLHPAVRGFASSVERYERGRPDYPAAAVERLLAWLDLRPGRTLLDLAAGTGKLTRQLVPSGAAIVAVEPVAEMRAELERRVPGVGALDGTAERIPLPAASVDGVTVGQAFHWFEPAEALREIQRVLRPGGGLALIWNTRDERDPLQAELSRIMRPHEGETPRRHQRDWAAVLDASGRFEPCEVLRFDHRQELDEEGLVGRVLSISFVAASPAATREEVEARVRALARRLQAPLRLPYVTELYLARRV